MSRSASWPLENATHCVAKVMWSSEMTTFIAKATELSDRFDPKYVLFARRSASFRYPAVRLGTLLSEPTEYGAAEAGVERTSESQPRYIRITDIDENGMLLSGLGATAENIDPAYFLSDGDLLFARSGNTVGKTYLHEEKRVDYPCFYAGYLIRFRFSDAVLSKYVFAFTQTPYYREWVSAIQRAAGQPNINAQEYRSLEIPLPPQSVQREVVAELDAAYAAKRAADERTANLLASIDDMVLQELGIARLPKPDISLAARMFTVPAAEVNGGRFDPMAYQRELRDFYAHVRRGKYDAHSLRNVVDIDRRQTDTLEGLTYVGLENIDGTDGSYVATEEKETVSSAVLFRPGTILFPKLRPYLNKAWLSNFSGAASTEFFPLIPFGVVSEYLITYLRLAIVAKVMTMLKTGNTLPRVQLEDVLALPVPVPPLPVQERIASKASEIRAEARKLKESARVSLEAAKLKIEKRILIDEQSNSRC